MRRLLRDDLRDDTGGVRIVELGLGLALKAGIRVLDRNHGGHPVPDVRPREIGVFILQDTDRPGIAVHDRGKGGLETGQMSASVGVVDVVAVAEDIFMKFIDILEGDLNLDPLVMSLKIDRLRQALRAFVHFPDVADDALRLVVGVLLRLIAPKVRKMDRQTGI